MEESEESEEIMELNYPKTELFEVIDTIGVPHPYCIGSAHLKYNDSMYLGKEQIEKMETDHPNKVRCDICKGKLSFAEHETALLVEVNTSEDLNKVKGLKEYLLSIKEQCETDGYVGFAFKQKGIK